MDAAVRENGGIFLTPSRPPRGEGKIPTFPAFPTPSADNQGVTKIIPTQIRRNSDVIPT